MHFCSRKMLFPRRNNFVATVLITFRIFASCVLLLLITSSISAQQNLQRGVLLPEVVSQQHSDQTYALYLPSAYAPNKKWPIVYAFDPAARGRMPVELMKDAAEKYGYIVVGSNNSRNGSGKVQAKPSRPFFRTLTPACPSTSAASISPDFPAAPASPQNLPNTARALPE